MCRVIECKCKVLKVVPVQPRPSGVDRGDSVPRVKDTSEESAVDALPLPPPPLGGGVHASCPRHRA